MAYLDKVTINNTTYNIQDTSTQTGVSNVFSGTTAYTAGQYVWYDGDGSGAKLYKFTADHVAGAWVGTDTVQAPLADDVADLKSAINDITESIICIKANPSDNYVPLFAKPGDSVTIKTSSGETFGGSTSVGFYDESRTSIASASVSATYGSARTLNVNLSRTAYYIKLTVSGWAGEDLIVINNSNLVYNQIKNDIKTVDDKIQYALYRTSNQTANYINKKYIALNVGVGNTVNTTPSDAADKTYIIIPCKSGDKFTVTGKGGSSARSWGFTDNNYKLLKVAGASVNVENLSVVAESDGYFIANATNTATYSLYATQIYKALDAVAGTELIRDYNDNVLGFSKINYFDSSTVTEGKYLTAVTGGLNGNEDYFTSDYIDVSELNTVKIYGSRFVCCYDANKSHLGSTYTPEADTRDSIRTQTLETGTKYIRVSTTNSMLNILQVGEEISESFHVDYDNYFLNKLILKNNQIKEESVIVDLSGKGDYTSFTLACKENYGNNRNIIVMPGTYDIVSEYTAIWGAESVASMADADSETFDGWQYGIKMNGRKFTFMSGAKLVLDWTGHTVDGTHRFSALRVERNVEIIGLDLDCTATFYAIHDDYGNNSEPYTVTYRNCRVIGHNLSNVNCIGGGCKKWSRHILDNCYFDNNTTVSTAVRYHNTNAEGAVPEIYVSNCYFGTYFRANYYGSQTSKMRVYVNNCQAKKIYKGAEGSASVDNVELHKWCNTETEPEETQNDL